MPLTFTSSADYDSIEQGDELKIEGLRKAIEGGGAVKLANVTKGTIIDCAANLSERQRGIVLDGGLLNYTNKNA